MFQHIILYSLYKMEGERSLTAPYYLIQGKQSIQTIQDANLFHLNRFFAIYKRLKKSSYDKIIDQLLNQNIIIMEKDNRYRMNKNKVHISSLQEQIKSYAFRGDFFHMKDTIFWERLLLLIQVWTHKKQHISSYIPIVENKEVEQWVKSMYKKTKYDVPFYLQRLYDELYQLLRLLGEENARFIVDQITGPNMIGLSNQQLQHKYSLSVEDVHLKTIHIIHFLLEHIDTNSSLLYEIANVQEMENKTVQLTMSAHKTNELWKKGYTLEQIAFQRKLKINTIYDHIVEIALQDDTFPFNQFVEKTMMEEVQSIIDRDKTYKLKRIKENVTSDISFFQIRLILTYVQKKRGKPNGQ